LSFGELTTAKEFLIEKEFTTAMTLEGMSKDGIGQGQGGIQHGLIIKQCFQKIVVLFPNGRIQAEHMDGVR
jgi:hypothetical protein